MRREQESYQTLAFHVVPRACFSQFNQLRRDDLRQG
jgi:hypothetical protein